jgi:hypothetical protein
MADHQRFLQSKQLLSLYILSLLDKDLFFAFIPVSALIHASYNSYDEAGGVTEGCHITPQQKAKRVGIILFHLAHRS